MRAGNMDDATSSFEIVRRITGDKWKFLIISYLFSGSRRFGELLYHIDSITKKVLTDNLRELEELEIVERTCYETGNLQKVVYQLSEIGHTLQPIFNELIMWGLRYSREHREKLDGAPGQGETAELETGDAKPR